MGFVVSNTEVTLEKVKISSVITHLKSIFALLCESTKEIPLVTDPLATSIHRRGVVVTQGAKTSMFI